VVIFELELWCNVSSGKIAMMETTISDPNLRTDFLSVINYYFKKETSVLLSKLVECGQLTLDVESDENQTNDGEATLFYIGEKPERTKQIEITIKESVAKSEFVCWRLACLIHELGHAIHFWESEDPPEKIVHHGDCWENLVKRNGVKGNLKECAIKEVSPNAQCIYQTLCIWCSPNSARGTGKFYKLPEVQEVNPQGGNCLFCFTEKSVVCHLRKSDDCREQYLLKYGPAYKTRIQYQSSKQERVKKRVGRYIGPSICNYCPAPADQRLMVHLRSNDECNKKYKALYKENTEDGLRKQILRENARIRKQKSRQRRNHK
jgi:hypothetical protein